MGKERLGRRPVLLVGAVDEGREYDDLGVTVDDGLGALEVMASALDWYQSEYKDCTKEGKARRLLAKVLVGKLEQVRVRYAQKLEEHYQRVVAGTSVRADSLEETRLETEKRREELWKRHGAVSAKAR